VISNDFTSSFLSGQLSASRWVTTVLNYCAYHPRPLVCDFVDRAAELGRFTVRDTLTGSKTPFINLDLRELRSLEDFLVEEHRLERRLVKPHCDWIGRRLLARIPVTHHKNSPLRQ
jgi:hypothetical protein